jgi:hypothetical protein
LSIQIVSPCRPQERRAHQIGSGRRVIKVEQNFQIDQSETQTKPSEFIRQHREDRIGTQWTSIPLLDLAVIKGIVSAMLASAPDQCVHDMPSYLQNTMRIISMKESV